MRKNKFIYAISSLAMACMLSFSGIGGSYLQAQAGNGVTDILWNDNESVMSNLAQYCYLAVNALGLYTMPSTVTAAMASGSALNFADYMLSDGYSQEEVNAVMNGGGHVRTGVTRDDNGNITFSDEVMDLFQGYIQEYLNETTGYYIAPTMSVEQVCNPLLYKTLPESELMRTMLDIFLKENEVFIRMNYEVYNESPAYVMQRGVFVDDSTHYFVFNDKPYNVGSGFGTKHNSTYPLLDGYFRMAIDVYNSSWVRLTHYDAFASDGDSVKNAGSVGGGDYPSGLFGHFADQNTQVQSHFVMPVTVDGRNIKIFKNLDAMKSYTVGKQPYYTTNTWNNYDNSIDNTTTITNAEYQYYTDNSTIIYNIIQGDLDNAGDSLTEKDVQNIVDNAVERVLKEIEDNSNNSGDGGNNSGNDSGDSGGSGGTGVLDVINGIGKILDTILSLIGNLMGVVADFTQSVLDLFGGFTTFTDGFTGFLSGAFAFIPVDIWNLLKVGLSLAILCAVINFLRK